MLLAPPLAPLAPLASPPLPCCGLWPAQGGEGRGGEVVPRRALAPRGRDPEGKAGAGWRRTFEPSRERVHGHPVELEACVAGHARLPAEMRGRYDCLPVRKNCHGRRYSKDNNKKEQQ